MFLLTAYLIPCLFSFICDFVTRIITAPARRPFLSFSSLTRHSISVISLDSDFRSLLDSSVARHLLCIYSLIVHNLLLLTAIFIQSLSPFSGDNVSSILTAFARLPYLRLPLFSRHLISVTPFICRHLVARFHLDLFFSQSFQYLCSFMVHTLFLHPAYIIPFLFSSICDHVARHPIISSHVLSPATLRSSVPATWFLTMALSTKIAPVFIKIIDLGPKFNQMRDHELKSISAKLNDLLGSTTFSEIMRMGDLIVHPLSVSDQKKLLSMQLIGDRQVSCKIPTSFAVSQGVITGV